MKFWCFAQRNHPYDLNFKFNQIVWIYNIFSPLQLSTFYRVTIIMVIVTFSFSLLSRLSFWFVCGRPCGPDRKANHRFCFPKPLVSSLRSSFASGGLEPLALNTRASAHGFCLRDLCKPSLWQRLIFFFFSFLFSFFGTERNSTAIFVMGYQRNTRFLLVSRSHKDFKN